MESASFTAKMEANQQEGTKIRTAQPGIEHERVSQPLGNCKNKLGTQCPEEKPQFFVFNRKEIMYLPDCEQFRVMLRTPTP